MNEESRVTPPLEQEVEKGSGSLELACLPEAGASFLGFQLMAELGRGAFSRVFLARQASLANRLVALKISLETSGEPHLLAQLQHTNIVPIHSAHSLGPLQAVCMPYFGPTTLGDIIRALHGGSALPESGNYLADLLRKTVRKEDRDRAMVVEIHPSPRPVLNKLEKLSYAQSVLWLGARLAEGLAHAHERGILHRDLKPANVLLSDEGQPMLLDFNLSEDLKSHSEKSQARLGGTLPYMAPEHLQAFHDGQGTIDARSDIFSLGVILYEALTGRLPFSQVSGPLAKVLPEIIAGRGRPPDRPGQWNRAASPAVDSIIGQCLAFEPAHRYQTARDLAEDLQRQLDNRPLRHAPDPSIHERVRKWSRRHPRLASPAALATFLGLLLAAILIPVGWISWREGQSHQIQARALEKALHTFQEFQKKRAGLPFLEEIVDLSYLPVEIFPGPEDLSTTLVDLVEALKLYDVLENPAWADGPQVQALGPGDQKKIHEEIHRILHTLNLARARGLAGNLPNVNLPPAPDQNFPPQSSYGFYWAARDKAGRGQFEQALGLLQKSIRRDGQEAGPWLLKAVCHHNLAEYSQDLDHYSQAEACYNTCLALKPDFIPGYVCRAQVYLRQKNWRLAKADVNIVLGHNPKLAQAHILRASALSLEAHEKCLPDNPLSVQADGEKAIFTALQELNQVLEKGASGQDFFLRFLRAQVQKSLPVIEKRPRDLKKVMEDNQWLVDNTPQSERDWVFRGLARLELGILRAKEEKITKESKNQTARESLADFDRALAHNSRNFLALYHKARLLADPLGKIPGAVAVLDQIVDWYPDFLDARVSRGTLLARQGLKNKAYLDAIEFLRREPTPLRYYQAAVIYALTSRTEAFPRDRPHALKLLAFALRNGQGWERFAKDPDLDSLAGEPEFQEMVHSAPILGRTPPPRMRPPEIGELKKSK